MLRRSGMTWKWGEEQQNAFEKLKKALSSINILVHYDPDLPLKVDCDASSIGIWAVMLHIIPDGSERPIMYASRTL